MSTRTQPGTELPPGLPDRVKDDASVVSAYEQVRAVEKSVLAEYGSASTQQGRDAASKRLIYCRIVGHFFYCVPTDQGLKNLVQEVNSTALDGEKVLDLGKLYFDSCIRLFRKAKQQTPEESYNPSRASFDTLADMIKVMLEEAPQNHQSVKQRALVRDKFRCVVSGRLDMASMLRSEELYRTRDSDLITKTELAHIFSESTNAGITAENSSKAEYSASAWAVLSRFGHEGLLAELNGPQIHRLENVMTLDPYIHHIFDSLMCWFTPTEQENTYRLEARDPRILTGFPRTVTFSTDDPVNLPVPSPNYLALHAACAKVAHLSGAAEYIDAVWSEMEETLFLAENGSSADALNLALLVSLKDTVSAYQHNAHII